MQNPVIWFYVFIPNTFCENTKLKGSFDNWTSKKSISIKNIFGYHIFILELNANFTNCQYKIVDCNNKYITLTDRNITNDIYQNCNIKEIDYNKNENNMNYSQYYTYNEDEQSQRNINYEITDDFCKIICKNSIFTIYIKNVLFYNGKLKNGLFTDYGKLYSSGNLNYQGKFKEGKKNGYGTLFNNKNQKIYTGYFINDDKKGFGIEYYKNGVIKYQGDWCNNKYDGKGIYFYDIGQIWYEGDWWKGKRFGIGTTYDDNGDIIFAGIYINDEEKIFNSNCKFNSTKKEKLDKTI